MRPSRRAVVLAAAGMALIVVASSFLAGGGLLPGAIAATRASARFAAVVLALAIASRASRPTPLASRTADLSLAFVAAQGVHYGTVIARAAIEPGNPLRHPSWGTLVVICGGFGLVLLLALTANATSGGPARAAAIAIYTLWVVFVVALGSRSSRSLPSALALAVVVLAMIWRVGFRRGGTMPASAVRASDARRESGGAG